MKINFNIKIIINIFMLIIAMFLSIIIFKKYFFNKQYNEIKHIGLILDGNRRFAKKKGILQKESYRIGAEKLLDIIDIALEEKILSITAYILTIDNFNKRPRQEIDDVFSVGLDFLNEKKDIFLNKDIKINFIGRLDLINDQNNKNKIFEIAEKTKNCKTLIVNLLFIYDYYDDLISSCKTLSQKVKNNIINIEDINIDNFIQNLTSKDVPMLDLIIRTGYHKRLSGFLPIQSIYAEIIFLDMFWPEITSEIFQKIIKQAKYDNMERNYGK